MTESLYWLDSYARRFSAKVTKAANDGVALDRSAFYPGGGGQPCDTGILVLRGTEYKVTETRKEGGDVFHTLDPIPFARCGDSVDGEIDWGRRYAYMRYHTALHLVGGIIGRDYEEYMSTGSQIYQDRARMDIDMTGLDATLARRIIDDANRVAAQGRAVTIKVLSRSEAMQIPDLAKTEPGRKLLESLATVRVVEIEGVDVQADGGTHVANTSEIGTISLSKFENKGSRRKRLEITLN